MCVCVCVCVCMCVCVCVRERDRDRDRDARQSKNGRMVGAGNLGALLIQFSVGMTLAMQGLERKVLVGAEILVLAIVS